MSNKCEICGKELMPDEKCNICQEDELSPREKLIEKIAIGFCFITVFGFFVKILFF